MEKVTSNPIEMSCSPESNTNPFAADDDRLTTYLRSLVENTSVIITLDHAGLVSQQPKMIELDQREMKKMSALDYNYDDDEENSEVEYYKLEVDLIVGSKLYQYPIELKHMNEYDSHTNTSVLYKDENIDEIITGYALNSNNVWIYHSWGVKDDKIIETTIAKRAYCGYPRFSRIRTL
jgi:hypothetical protein